MNSVLYDDEEELRRCDATLRLLARRLGWSEPDAEDAVQEGWLRYLARPPRDSRRQFEWLRVVVLRMLGRMHRENGNERARLRPRAVPDEGPSALDEILCATSGARVLGWLQILNEPYREVLRLRYLEDLSTAEIAARLGRREGTVRVQTKRGLDELRTRLGGRKGSRASWSALLLPLARRAPRASGAPSLTASKALAGVLAMSATEAALVGAGLIVVAGAVLWGLDAPGSVLAHSSAAVAEHTKEELAVLPEPAAKGRQDDLVPETRGVRVAVESTAQPAAAATVAETTVRTATVDVRFVDPAGAPLGGVRFGPEDGPTPWKAWNEPTLSDAEGNAQLVLAFPEIRPEIGPIDECQVELVASRPGSTTVGRSAMVRVGETAHLGDVVLGPAVRLAGRVVDDLGRGVANATIGKTAAEFPPEEEGRLRRHGQEAFGSVPSARSSEDGSFVLDGVGAGTWRLWGHASGTRYAWSDPIAVTAERDLFGFELVLTPLLPGDRIEGRIVDPEGHPVQVGLSSVVHDERHGETFKGTSVDQQGRFAVVIRRDGETWDFTAQDSNGRFGSTTVTGVSPGTLDLVIRMREARFVTLRVRDDEDRPVERASFYVFLGGVGRELRPPSSAPGDYRTTLPEARFDLEASAPGFHTRYIGPFEPAALPDVLDVVLERAPLVRGRVTADGRPLEHALVELRRDDPGSRSTVNGFRCVMWPTTDAKGPSDSSGRFELTADLDEAFWIRVTAEGFAPAEIGPIGVGGVHETDDFAVALTRGGAIEGRVLLAEGHGEGAIVAINHGDGAPRTMRAGPGGYFHFAGLAPGKWQVLPSEVELDSRAKSFASTEDPDPIEWSCEVIAGRTARFDLDLRP
jgi:RNA polymerase sigma-70 factor (ECF subfamily)